MTRETKEAVVTVATVVVAGSLGLGFEVARRAIGVPFIISLPVSVGLGILVGKAANKVAQAVY